MRQATEPTNETLPGAWAGIHEQLRNGRDRLDDAYVTVRDFRFRVGRLGELEEKHQTELAPHRMSVVTGPRPGPGDRGLGFDPHVGSIGFRHPDDPVPLAGDLVPYLSLKGDRDVFLEAETWADLAGPERPSRTVLASLADDPAELENCVNRQMSRKWSGDTRLFRMMRLGQRNRGARRLRAILPDDYVRLDSIYLLPGLYRSLCELGGFDVGSDAVSSRLTPDEMFLDIRASRTFQMLDGHEHFAAGMSLYNTEVAQESLSLDLALEWDIDREIEHEVVHEIEREVVREIERDIEWEVVRKVDVGVTRVSCGNWIFPVSTEVRKFKEIRETIREKVTETVTENIRETVTEIVTEKIKESGKSRKEFSVPLHVSLGREAYSGLPPAVLPEKLQGEINEHVRQAVHLRWKEADQTTTDIKRRIGDLARTPVSLGNRDEVRRAVGALAASTGMHSVPGVQVEQIVDAYYTEVERERNRMAGVSGSRQPATIAGTAWGLHNAFTYYVTHLAGRQQLSTVRRLHHIGGKFLDQVDWEQLRVRASFSPPKVPDSHAEIALPGLAKTPALSESPNTERLHERRKPRPRLDKGHPRLR